MINRSFKDFKKKHQKKINQVIYSSISVENENFLINLINNFLSVKNSFVFESVEKGKIRGNIYGSYDIFINNKYKVKINEKSVERVKNYFR